MAMSVSHIFGMSAIPILEKLHEIFNIQIPVISRFFQYHDVLRDTGGATHRVPHVYDRRPTVTLVAVPHQVVALARAGLQTRSVQDADDPPVRLDQARLLER